MMSQLGSINTLYDNSKAFDKYLQKQDLEKALRETKLKLKTKHTIVPHVRAFSTSGSVSATRLLTR